MKEIPIRVKGAIMAKLSEHGVTVFTDDNIRIALKGTVSEGKLIKIALQMKQSGELG